MSKMDDICSVCGYGFGLHCYVDELCPVYSNSVNIWRDTVFTPAPKPCASCSQLRDALAAEQQRSAVLAGELEVSVNENIKLNNIITSKREKQKSCQNCAGYQDDNAQLYAWLAKLTEENDELRKELEAYKAQSYIGMSEHDTKESMREYLGFKK